MLQETFFMYIYMYKIAEMEEHEVKGWLYLIC